MRESSCLLPDVLCLASYTCGLHYSLPPACLHADDMNNRSLAIKARVWEGWQTSPAADADLCTLTEKAAARWLTCAAWLGGVGAYRERGAGSWEETLKRVPAGEGRWVGEARDKAGLVCTLMGRADVRGGCFLILCEHAHIRHLWGNCHWMHPFTDMSIFKHTKHLQPTNTSWPYHVLGCWYDQ